MDTLNYVIVVVIASSCCTVLLHELYTAVSRYVAGWRLKAKDIDVGDTGYPETKRAFIVSTIFVMMATFLVLDIILAVLACLFVFGLSSFFQYLAGDNGSDDSPESRRMRMKGDGDLFDVVGGKLFIHGDEGYWVIAEPLVIALSSRIFSS